MVNFVYGILGAVLFALALLLTHNITEVSTQSEIKRKCEAFGVVDLPARGAMFYCSRKPIQPPAAERKP